MTQRHLISHLTEQLFPYTTLFRSVQGVPVIAVTSGVERERPGRKRWRGLGLFDGEQARLGVGCRETAIGERRPAPAIWLHHVIGRVRNRAMVADIEYAPAIILIGRKTGMLAVDVGGPIIGDRKSTRLNSSH